MLSWIKQWLNRRNVWRKARQYNTNNSLPGSGRGTWMCPDCGTVHRQIRRDHTDGPIYGSCCSFKQGGRIGRRYANPI